MLQELFTLLQPQELLKCSLFSEMFALVLSLPLDISLEERDKGL